MRKQKWRMLLLVLVVVLLAVVSSRVSPKLPDDDSTVSVSDDITDTDDKNYVTPTPTPDPSVPQSPPPSTEPVPEEELPDVSIHEWELKLVNNRNVLTQSFAPDVTEFIEGQFFDTRAVPALNSLIEAAKLNGYAVHVSTAYRPYSTQAYIFFGKASQIAWGGEVSYADAEVQARELVAYPGTSEHQLGLAVDLIDSASTTLIAEDVEDMPLLVWLKENCAKFGFILRYPKDKEDITDWYEPWHFRYVGVEAAEFIMEKGICLEEFLDLYKPQV